MEKNNCYNCKHRVKGGSFCGFTEEVCECYVSGHPLHMISYNHDHPETCNRWEKKKENEDEKN